MIHIILGGVAALLACGALRQYDGGEEQVLPLEPEPAAPTKEEEFARVFRRLPGDRRIVQDDAAPLLLLDASERRIATPQQYCLGRETRIRRYRPTYAPCPWELQVADSGDGMEEFALLLHPSFAPARFRIARQRQRPMDISKAFSGSPELLTRNPFFENRLRHSHVDEGIADWFAIDIETDWAERWRFEHQSLCARSLRERARQQISSTDHKTASDARTATEEADAQTKAASIFADEVDRRIQGHFSSLAETTSQLAAVVAQFRALTAAVVSDQRFGKAGGKVSDDPIKTIERITKEAQRFAKKVESMNLDADDKDKADQMIALVKDQAFEALRVRLAAGMTEQ